jgi:hypothetical protein
VHEDQDVELLRLGEERPEARIGEFQAADIGADLDAAQAQLFHQPLELGDRQLGRLQRHRAEANETIGM